MFNDYLDVASGDMEEVEESIPDFSTFVSKEEDLHKMGVTGVIKKPSSFSDIMAAIKN